MPSGTGHFVTTGKSFLRGCCWSWNSTEMFALSWNVPGISGVIAGGVSPPPLNIRSSRWISKANCWNSLARASTLYWNEFWEFLMFSQVQSTLDWEWEVYPLSPIVSNTNIDAVFRQWEEKPEGRKKIPKEENRMAGNMEIVILAH